MRRLGRLLGVALLAGAVPGLSSAATLNVVGGQLVGASDVDVGGTLYDVAFVEGSCISLFSGCDEVSDFTFQTEAAATLASQALMDQVFLDGVAGTFDSNPELTFGCSDTVDCRVFTPFDPVFFSDVYMANNWSAEFFDSVSLVGVNNAFDTATYIPGVYAVWTPEPSTALLLGLGLTALAARRRAA